MQLRSATADDAPFLLEMVAAAVDWRPGAVVRPVAAVLAAPELAHYAVGWPRPGERGTIAHGADGDPLGAAWWRTFPAEQPGYGFVAPDVPELSVAVLPRARGRGVGTALLQALIAGARAAGLRALSLSVEPDNPAVRLYARLGFRAVGATGGSRTMLLELDRRP